MFFVFVQCVKTFSICSAEQLYCQTHRLQEVLKCLAIYSAMQGNKVAKCHCQKTQWHKPWRLTMVRALLPFIRASLVLRFTGPAIGGNELLPAPAPARPHNTPLTVHASRRRAYNTVTCSHHWCTCMCVDFAVAWVYPGC